MNAACWLIEGVNDGHGPKWCSWTKKAMIRFSELPKYAGYILIISIQGFCTNVSFVGMRPAFTQEA